MEFDDIVTLKTRTGETVAIMNDSRERYVEPGKKGLKVPREIANLGVKQHAYLWDSQSGAVKESLLYIEEDIDTQNELPYKKVNMDDVKKIKKTDGLDKGKAFIDGKFIEMKTLELSPTKEDFTINNR